LVKEVCNASTCLGVGNGAVENIFENRAVRAYPNESDSSVCPTCGSYAMITTAGTRQSTTVATIVGGLVGVLLVWRTGLLSAFPAAAGLTTLAAIDLETQRLPEHIVKRTALLMGTLGIMDVSRLHRPDRFATAYMTAMLIGFVAASVWITTSGIAFGDVKLLAIAAFVPAWIRGSAAITMVAIAFVTAAAYVVIRRLRLRGQILEPTIAFAPFILVGWVVAVVTA
jgi:prepilin signal peptidase PulO-like enzyme (type II secretory pathway)